MREHPRWPAVVIAVTLSFLYLPLVVMAVLSLSSRSVALFPLQGFTFDWYRTLLEDERFRNTGLNSLSVAAVSTAIGLLLGTSAAFGLSRLRGRVVGAVASLYVGPIVVPSLVLGIAMALAFNMYGVPLSFWTLVIGHSLLAGPLIYLLVSARLRGFDWSVLQAARVLGAGPVVAFRRVMIPLLLPAIAGGGLLSFALSLDNFILSFFLTGGDSTLPLLMWSMMRQGFSPAINAVATMLLAVALACAVIGERLSRR